MSPHPCCTSASGFLQVQMDFFGLCQGQKLADGAFLQHIEEESLKQVMEI